MSLNFTYFRQIPVLRLQQVGFVDFESAVEQVLVQVLFGIICNLCVRYRPKQNGARRGT